jgi:hypothetical protein
MPAVPGQILPGSTQQHGIVLVNHKYFACRAHLKSLIGTMPDKISHSITMDMRVTPNIMTSPSRVVNFDRFMAPLLS